MNTLKEKRGESKRVVMGQTARERHCATMCYKQREDAYSHIPKATGQPIGCVVSFIELEHLRFIKHYHLKSRFFVIYADYQKDVPIQTCPSSLFSD